MLAANFRRARFLLLVSRNSIAADKNQGSTAPMDDPIRHSVDARSDTLPFGRGKA